MPCVAGRGPVGVTPHPSDLRVWASSLARGLRSGGPSAGADELDAGLVVDLGALGHVASAVARDFVVEGVWSAGCDGVYVVDLE